MIKKALIIKTEWKNIREIVYKTKDILKGTQSLFGAFHSNSPAFKFKYMRILNIERDLINNLPTPGSKETFKEYKKRFVCGWGSVTQQWLRHLPTSIKLSYHMEVDNKRFEVGLKIRKDKITITLIGEDIHELRIKSIVEKLNYELKGGDVE